MADDKKEMGRPINLKETMVQLPSVWVPKEIADYIEAMDKDGARSEWRRTAYRNLMNEEQTFERLNQE